jgi:segregation and condensation protein B
MLELTRRIEAILLMSPSPVTVDALAAACGVDAATLVPAVEELHSEYDGERHGVAVRLVAGGLQFVVAPDCEGAVVAHSGARAPDELSPALLETLSVVAYLQPTTRAEVARIRGVAADYALSSLEERGLIEERGRSDAPGSPILYATTDRFLLLFGLNDLADLPPLEEFMPSQAEADELRERLLANAERRSQ